MESGRNSRIKTHHELLHSRDFRCCCCIHVRTGTVAFGLVHVMMQMATVAIFATAILNPDALTPPKTVVQPQMDIEQSHLEIHRDTISQISSVMRASKQDLVSALLLSTLFGFISMLLVYGAFWGNPNYILPFFGILCCDFATAMLRLIGSFAEHHTSPHTRDAPLHGFYLMMTVMLKAYLLNMVWSCFKYLRLRQELLRNPPVAISSQPTMATRPAAMEASQLLPDYEATQKYPYSFYASPPPPYSMATQMPTVGQVVAPPPSYDDVAGTSRQVDLPPEAIVVEGATAAAPATTAAAPLPIIPPELHACARAASQAAAAASSSSANDTDGLNASQEARTAADHMAKRDDKKPTDN